MLHKCFKQDCEFEVQYVCQCLSVDTYSCKHHLVAHLRLPNRTHSFGSILIEPSEGTKYTILGFLENEKSKIINLKEIVSTSFRPNLYNSENSVKEALSKLDSDLEKTISLIEIISQTPKQEQDPYYNLHTDTDEMRDPVPEFSEVYKSLKLRRLCDLRSEKCPILSGPNNAQVEQEFRRACLWYENQSQGSKLTLSNFFDNYANAYHQITSLYHIGKKDKRTNLLIYDTENEAEQAKVLEIPLPYNLDNALIVQLPSGKLFCISDQSITYIIDKNYRVRKLSIKNDFRIKTAIHFKGFVYCFGYDTAGISHLKRFDLDKYHWFRLAPASDDDYDAYSIRNSLIFNEKILISGYHKKTLLLYSIDIDSFANIPYDFSKNSSKILINEAERVYLIEYPGFIHESEVSDIYNWQQIAESIIDLSPNQVYCSYNRGEIYISAQNKHLREYYKFDLDRKTLTEVAYYNKHIAIRRTNNGLEAINCYNQTFKLSSDYVEGYIKKGNTLLDLVEELEEIECSNEEIKLNPSNHGSYYEAIYNSEKGVVLADLDRKNEAIESYNEAINVNPSYPDSQYNN